MRKKTETEDHLLKAFFHYLLILVMYVQENEKENINHFLIMSFKEWETPNFK